MVARGCGRDIYGGAGPLCHHGSAKTIRSSCMPRLRLALLVSLLLLPRLLGAASLQYVNPGTALTFQDSGGTAVLTFASKATNNGHYSDRVDLGDPHSPWYILRCSYRMGTAGTVGSARLEYYLSWGTAATGTAADSTLAATNATITSTNTLLNLKPALVVVLDNATTTTDVIGSALVNIPTQYVQLAYMNLAGQGLSATANVSSCSLIPAP